MANNNAMNLTLYFDYENNEAGFKHIMSSLDRISAQAEQIMLNSSNFVDKNEMEKSIKEYKKYIERVKEALETSWSPETQSFNLNDALEYDPKAFSELRNGFRDVSTSIVETDDTLRQSGATINKYSEQLDNFKLTIANAFRYNVVNEFVDVISTQIRDVVSYVKELDKALNDIRIVSGQTSEDMYNFAEGANESGKALGRTATEYAKAALIYYQQGLKQEEVIARTNDTLILANITGASVADAADKLTSVMNGYQLAAEDSTRALDVMAKLGADTATDFDEIATAMQKVAAQANGAGLELEETSAILATIMSITREAPETVGTSVKAIISRLNEIKFASGEETSRVERQYKQIGMSIFDANGQLKDTMQLLTETAEAFKTADKNTKAIIATGVAGAEQQNRFITLMENWDLYNEYLAKAYDSSGSALEQNEIYMDSIQAKASQLKSTIDAIKFDLFMGEDWGEALETLDGIAVFARGLIDDFGGLNQILTVAGAVLIKMFGPEVWAKISAGFTTLKASWMDLKSVMSQSDNRAKGLSEILFGKTNNFNEQFNNIRTNLGNVRQELALVEQAGKYLGPAGAKEVEIYIQKLKELEVQENKSTQKLAKGFNLGSVNGVFKWSDSLGSIEERLKSLGISGNNLQAVISVLDTTLQRAGSQEMSVSEVTKLLATTIQDLGIVTDITDDKLQEHIAALIGADSAARRTGQAMEEMAAKMQRAQQIQLVTNYLMAASVAVNGLFNAFKQFEEGDTLGGVAGSLTSIGSALMFINPLAGAAVTLVGSVFSGVATKIKEYEQQTQEMIQKNLELSKSFNQVDVDQAINTYNELAEKTARTTEEQQKLNDAISALNNNLGTNEDFIAYYDEQGNAVYKTKEQIEELTKARYADIEAATKQAVADAKNGAKSESNKNIVQANENIREFIELKEKAQSMSDKEWEKYIEDSPEVKMEYGVSGNKTEDMNKLDVDIDNWTEIRDRAVANSEKELENTIIAIENSATAKLGATVDKNTSLIAEKVSSSVVESVKNGQVDAQKTIEENSLAFWDSVNEIISGEDTKGIWDKAIQGNKEAVNELNVLFAKMGYTANNPYMKALNEILLENVETSKEVAEQNATTGKSYKELADTFSDWGKNIKTGSSAIEEWQEQGRVSSDTIKELYETFKDTDAVDDFIEVLNDSESTSEDVQEAFNNLVNSFTVGKNGIEGLTEANKDYVISELEAIGVMNASEIVEAQLIAQRTELKDATNILKDANGNLIGSEDALTGVINGVGLATDAASLSMYNYYLNKVATEGISIVNNEVAGANALIAMAQALAGAGDQMERWIQLKSIEAKVESGDYSGRELDRLEQRAKKIKEELAGWTPDSITVDSGFFNIDNWKGAGGGGSGGGSRSEEYQAEIDKYYKIKEEIEAVEREISSLDTKISDTESYDEKNKLLDDKIKLLKKEQDLQKQLNTARDEEIKANVELLRQKGFEVEYNPESDTLNIKNLEKLSKLKGETAKETEKLIEATKDLNKENQEASDKWQELTKAIKESTEAQEENRRSRYEDNLEDTLFKTTYFEDMYGQEEKIKSIYVDAFNQVATEWKRLLNEGYDDTDEYVQSVIEKYYDLKQKIIDADQEIYERNADQIDALIKALEQSDRAGDALIEQYGKKVDNVKNRIEQINNLLKDNTANVEEYAKTLLALYDDLISASKDLYEARKKELEQQKSDYDDTIDAVTNVIDEEINRLKEEKEALREINEEKEREMELAKAKAALERAQNQKTIQVYREGIGFVWEADQDAINAAQEAVDKLQMEDEEAQFDKRIEELEDYKEQWESIPDTVDKAEKEIKASETLGAGWEKDVLNMRSDTLEDFKTNYQGVTDGIKDLNSEWADSTNSVADAIGALITKLQTLTGMDKTMEESAESIESSTKRIVQAQADGSSVQGLKPGDISLTKGGAWEIGSEGQEGFNYHKSSGYWAKKVSDDSYNYEAGSEVTDPEVMKKFGVAIEENNTKLTEAIDLQTIANDLEVTRQEYEVEANKEIPLLKNEIASNNTSVSSLITSLDNLRIDLQNYTLSILEAVGKAKSYATSAESSARQSKEYKNEARDYAKQAETSASKSSGAGGTMKAHTGLNAGPVGSYAGEQAFNSDLLRIANGDLKNDEIFALLKKGEAVLLPEQLNNIVGAINFSLSTIDQLQSMQTDVFSAGVLAGLNVDTGKKSQSSGTSFGDINIVMNGVNDVNTFGKVLGENVKNIFAQTVAGI